MLTSNKVRISSIDLKLNTNIVNFARENGRYIKLEVSGKTLYIKIVNSLQDKCYAINHYITSRPLCRSLCEQLGLRYPTRYYDDNKQYIEHCGTITKFDKKNKQVVVVFD